MFKKAKKWLAGLMCITMLITMLPGNFVFSEEGSTGSNTSMIVSEFNDFFNWSMFKNNG